MTRINRRFLRHYAEMVAVMFLGMVVLGPPVELALGAIDSSWSELSDNSPGLMLLLMAFTMTAPMVAWMDHRGHGGRPIAEMALAMIVPTLGAVALLGAGLVEHVDSLLVVEHVAMLAAMFAVMLARPEEYSGHHRAHAVTA